MNFSILYRKGATRHGTQACDGAESLTPDALLQLARDMRRKAQQLETLALEMMTTSTDEVEAHACAGKDRYARHH